MAKWYCKLNETQENIFWLGLVTIIVFALLSPLFFFSQGGVPLGWLFGSLIEIVCYILLVKGSDLVVNANGKTASILISLALGFARLLLYGAGFALGALCSFYWHCKIISFWGVFASYIPLLFVLGVRFLIASQKKPDADKSKGA